VEEVLRSLIDSGALVRNPDDGSWTLARDLNEIPIPETLQGVLMARIDRLQEESKRVLQVAAVIGRIFRAASWPPCCHTNPIWTNTSFSCSARR